MARDLVSRNFDFVWCYIYLGATLEDDDLSFYQKLVNTVVYRLTNIVRLIALTKTMHLDGPKIPKLQKVITAV